MGVLNLTPNSFSDGGLLEDPIALQKQLSSFSTLVDILDIGAESTAPFNDAISLDEEQLRLKGFLDSVDLKSYNFPFISLDTYKSKIAHWFFEELKGRGLDEEKFIWNDVSGKLDEEVIFFLKSFKKANYIFCHNLAPKRSMSSQHMNYVDSQNSIFESVRNFFDDVKSHEFRDRIILDPCFGFSKDHSQNLELIDRFSELVDLFDSHQWIFGISKKSFLRQLWSEEIEPGLQLSKQELLEKSEKLHLGHLLKVMKECSDKKISFRVHDPLLYKSSLFLTAKKLSKN